MDLSTAIDTGCKEKPTLILLVPPINILYVPIFKTRTKGSQTPPRVGDPVHPPGVEEFVSCIVVQKRLVVPLY